MVWGDGNGRKDRYGETPTANEVRIREPPFFGEIQVGEIASFGGCHRITRLSFGQISSNLPKSTASKVKNCLSRWWFQTVCIFTPIFGVSWSQFDVRIFFQMGSEQPPTSYPLEGFVLNFLIKKSPWPPDANSVATPHGWLPSGIYEAAARWLGDSRGAIFFRGFFNHTTKRMQGGNPNPPEKIGEWAFQGMKWWCNEWIS